MPGITTAAATDRSRNALRPSWLHEIVGQEKAKRLMRRAIASCFERVRPLDHVLLVGPSGTGKSTFSHVIANELGVNVFSVEAPVSTDMLRELRTKMAGCSILMIEEIHRQGGGDRRGRAGDSAPEILYSVMEDRVMQTPEGPLPFADITIIGTTTDEGLLPDPFINRFPLRPRLVAYTTENLQAIVRANADTLGVLLADAAVDVFAGACRGIPREVNNLVKNAAMMARPGQFMFERGALDVLDINCITRDGLTADMQATLVFLYTKARRVGVDGGVRYQAGLSTIATAIGKSRDSKAVVLRVEPYLIERGLLQVAHGGRVLTDAGVARAKELIA